MRAALAIVFAIIWASGVSASSPNPWEPHFNARASVIAAHAANVGKKHVLILGDSNTEMFWWTQNGGCRVINAGMGGARIRDLATRADWIAETTEPRIVHVMIGTNNLYLLPSDDEYPTMAADLTTIVQAFKSRGAHVVLWPIPPTSETFPNAGNRDHINSIVQQVAAATSSSWDWWWPLQITGDDGFAAPGALTGDGVHLSASSQVSRFNRLEVWRAHIGVTCG